MKENTNIFDRILLVSDYHGYKNIRDIAINGFKYKSAEKLYRLRDEKKKPSIDILVDISNKFEKVNIDWLLTGKGNMLKSGKNDQITELNNDQIPQLREKINELQGEIITLQREKIQYKDQINELEKELEKGKNIVALSSVKIA